MIIAQVSNAYVSAALSRAAHAEEDVLLDPERVQEALDFGYPRLLVRTEEAGRLVLPDELPVMVLTEATLGTWEAERRSVEVPPNRITYLARKLEGLMERRAAGVTWVDRTLADLAKAGGAPLPPSLRSFARRVMEFPSWYDDLQPVADSCGLSRGALKARFRRRGLPSPYSYLRWFRVMACAHLLADDSLTVAQTASRTGFTSDGNLCRSIMNLTGFTPTDLRSAQGRNRLLLAFAWDHLTPEALGAWHDLDELFVRRAG